jgi:hypothetical protein
MGRMIELMLMMFQLELLSLLSFLVTLLGIN